MEGREWHMLKNPTVLLANGILVFDEDSPGECGRLVFWLGELPPYTLFVTEHGTTLERIRHDRVRVRFPSTKGEKTIDIPPQPIELIAPGGGQFGVSTSSTPSSTWSNDDGSVYTDAYTFSSHSSHPDRPSTTRIVSHATEHGTHATSSSSTSWWNRLRLGSSSTSETKTAHSSPLEVDEEPNRRQSHYDDGSYSVAVRPSSSEKVSSSSAKDRTRKKAAKGLGRLAEDDEIQERGGALLSRLAKDKAVQKMVGDAVAEGSDNSFMGKMARNPKVQEKIASKLSAAATNKTVQKKVGKMVRDFAENEEAQAKAAGVFGSLLQSALSRD